MQNYKQIYAKKQECEKRIKAICPYVDNTSGIYAFTRVDENGIKHAYIGQAKHLLKRCAEHLLGYQYIDLSIKKHGLIDKSITGYNLAVFPCEIADLDGKEQALIKAYAEKGYQLKNRTAGSQGKGKTQIAEYKPSKTYRQGVEYGYLKAKKELQALFKYLTVDVKKDNKISQRMFGKFKDFLEIE